MQKHKIFKLLSTFSKKDLNNLRNFLGSKYFVSNKKILPLFEAIIHFYPNFSSSQLTKEYLHSKIYGIKEYSDSTMRDLFSDLLHLCNQFLAFEEIKGNSNLIDITILDVLRKRRQYELFERISDNIKNNISERKIDINLLSDKIKFDAVVLNYLISKERSLDKKEAQKRLNIIEESGRNLTSIYFVELVERYLKIQLYIKKYNIDCKNNKLGELLDIINGEKLKEILTLDSNTIHIYEIFHKLLTMYENIGVLENFLDYRNTVLLYKSKLSEEDLYYHYSCMISYCVLLNESGKRTNEVNDILFEIYNEYLSNKYFISKNSIYLNNHLFRDIIFFGLSIQKIDWTKDIIINYCDKIIPSQRDNMYNFAIAHILFTEKDFVNALKHLELIILDYFVYKYDYYNLKLKLFYEMNEIEAGFCLLHTYFEFLRHNQMKNEGLKLMHKNYALLMDKLFRVKSGDDKIKATDILFELNTPNKIIYKNWLQQVTMRLIENEKKQVI